MSNHSRLLKLEKAANEFRKQKSRRQKSDIDFSTFSDDELDSLYAEYVINHPFPNTTRYDGLNETQMSELYMSDIRAGQLKNSK